MTLSTDTNEHGSERPRGQFGIGRLMVLTAVVAVIMTIAVRLHAPRVMQGLFAGYLFFFAMWAVVRGPSVYADLKDLKKKRKQIKQRRNDLQRELAEMKHCRESEAEQEG